MNGKVWTTSWTIISNVFVIVVALGFWWWTGFDPKFREEVLTPTMISSGNILLRIHTIGPVLAGPLLEALLEKLRGAPPEPPAGS